MQTRRGGRKLGTTGTAIVAEESSTSSFASRNGVSPPSGTSRFSPNLRVSCRDGFPGAFIGVVSNTVVGAVEVERGFLKTLLCDTSSATDGNFADPVLVTTSMIS